MSPQGVAQGDDSRKTLRVKFSLGAAGVLVFVGTVACGKSVQLTPMPSAVASVAVPVDPGLVASSAPSTQGIVRERVQIDDVAVPSTSCTVHISWKTPEGTGVNDDAPFRLKWTTSEGLSEPPEDVTSKGATVESGFDVALRPTKGATIAQLGGTIDLVVCDTKTHAVCVPVKRHVEMNFLVGKGKDARIAVTVPLPAARVM